MLFMISLSGLSGTRNPHDDCGHAAITRLAAWFLAHRFGGIAHAAAVSQTYNCGATRLGQGIRNVLRKFTLGETALSPLSLRSPETPVARSARDLESRRLVQA